MAFAGHHLTKKLAMANLLPVKNRGIKIQCFIPTWKKETNRIAGMIPIEGASRGVKRPGEFRYRK